MPLTTFLRDRPPFNPFRFGLSDVGHVGRGTFTSNNAGEATEVVTWSADIPCRIDAAGGGERNAQETIVDASTHIITLPAHTDVTLKDDFLIDGRGTYEITVVREYTSELLRQIEVVPRT